ncbi:MAG: phage terminase large subunit [Hyphomonadaceae bacterium]|nr:phage terminase large subunit [Hyphomonadaceae bacterium]
MTKAQAARELLQRRAIRRSLTEYARYKGFNPARHHRHIIAEIESFLESDDEILLLAAPPGSAKSTYLSQLFPPWYLARYPGNSILAATHSVEFAERWGRRCRNDVAADGRVLGIELAGDSQAAARWALSTGGEYYGVGAGVGISGFRADLGLGDDFFGSREDAFSETVRRKRWDWYLDDFSSRLRPGAKRILMNTRWHDEDVAGRVMEQLAKGQLRGRIVSLAAEAKANDPLGREVGQWLWDDQPEYDYPAFLRARKRETSPMMWAALYQQDPAPEEGEFFQRGWFHRFTPDEKPKRLSVFGTSDYAVSEGKGDFTVHRVWGIDEHGHIWLLGGWRGQTTSDVWIERLLDLVHAHRPFAWFGESGVIQKSVEPYLLRRSQERRVYCRWEWLPSITDKSARARGFQARAAMKMVHVPEGADGDAFIEELIRFPAGKHDDEVDTASLMGRALDEAHPATKAAPVEKQARPDYGFGRKQNTGDWMTS